MNQVLCEGATEKVLTLKQMTTILAKGVFTTLNPGIPQETPVTFIHPVLEDVYYVTNDFLKFTVTI